MHVIALFHLLNCALQTLVFTTLYAFHMHMLFRWDYFTNEKLFCPPPQNLMNVVSKIIGVENSS